MQKSGYQFRAKAKSCLHKVNAGKLIGEYDIAANVAAHQLDYRLARSAKSGNLASNMLTLNYILALSLTPLHHIVFLYFSVRVDIHCLRDGDQASSRHSNVGESIQPRLPEDAMSSPHLSFDIQRLVFQGVVFSGVGRALAQQYDSTVYLVPSAHVHQLANPLFLDH